MKKIVFSLTLSLVSIFAAFADALDFKDLAMRKQLSNYSVMALYQDERGLIWIGTRNGINIYDGMHIETHLNDPADSSSVVNNLIQNIVGDKNGTVYVMTKQGVSEYSITKDRYKTITEKNVQSIKLHEGGLLIARGNKLFLYHKADGSLTDFYSLPDVSATITDFQLKGDSLIVGTELQGLFIYEKKKNVLTNTIKNVRVSKIFNDSSNETWIATWTNGVYRINGKDISK